MGQAPRLSRAYFAFASRAQSDLRLRQANIVSGVAAAFTQSIARHRTKAALAEDVALTSLVLIAGERRAISGTGRGLLS